MALSEACRRAIEAEFPKYREKRAVLLTALHLVMAEKGYVGLEDQEEVAKLLGILPVEVRQVVTFYPMFKEKPAGRYRVQVCTNLSCSLSGARKVVRALSEALGIEPGETTEDGQYSLEEVQCLGACGMAVAVQVNNEPYIENVKVEEIGALLGKIKRNGTPDASSGGEP